jgi:hypothetical protein
MPEIFCRFRPLASIFRFQELEEQQIYFSDPKELNDPIEGYLDIFWQGDGIVWKNLFKNYLYCLFNVQIQEAVNRANFELNSDCIPVSSSIDDLPFNNLKELLSIAYDAFFDNKSITKLIESLSSDGVKIRKAELFIYLKSVHNFALQVLVQASGLGLGHFDPKKVQAIVDQLKKLENFPNEVRGSENFEVQLEVAKATEFSTELNRALLEPDFLNSNKKRFIGFEFPQRYLDKLESLMYPRWYAACFTDFTSIENAAIWSHYGNDHEGICLLFKTEPIGEDRVGLGLHDVVSYGSGGRLIERRIRTFEKMEYDIPFPEVDFFASLGRLTDSQSFKHWYSDGKGNVSPCRNKLMFGSSEGIEKLWAPYHKSSTIKLREWKDESEWRIVKNGLVSDTLGKEDRLLKYDFSSLHGIVFGIKTPLEAKAHVVEIIRRKCNEEKRIDFIFYQAIHSRSAGMIKIDEIKVNIFK